MSQPSVNPPNVLEDLDYLISLLPDSDTVVNDDVRAYLRSVCPQFAALKCRPACRLSRKICLILRARGKTFLSAEEAATSSTSQIPSHIGLSGVTKNTPAKHTPAEKKNRLKRVEDPLETRSATKLPRLESNLQRMCVDLNVELGVAQVALRRKPRSWKTKISRIVQTDALRDPPSIPFVGMERVTKGLNSAVKSQWATQSVNDSMNLLVECGSSVTVDLMTGARNPQFDIYASGSYQSRGASRQNTLVTEIARYLVKNCIRFPGYSRPVSYKAEIATNLKHAQAAICRAISKSNESISAAMPLCFVDQRSVGSCSSDPPSCVEYALAFIMTTDGASYLLPLNIWTFGFFADIGAAKKSAIQDASAWNFDSRYASKRAHCKSHEVFQGQPGLSFTDCFEILPPTGTSVSRGWWRRRLTHFIGIAWDVSQHQSKSFQDNLDIPYYDEKFTDMSTLTSKLLQVCAQVRWRTQPPLSPFDKISPADFEFNPTGASDPRRSSASLWHRWADSMGMDDPLEFYQEHLVGGGLTDGNASCQLYQTCTELAMEGSWCCIRHSRCILRHSSTAMIPSGTLADIQFHRLEERHSALTMFQDLVQRFEHRPDQTWIIDCEFVNLSQNRSAVPTEISIRTLHGRSIVSAVVIYPGCGNDADAVVEKLKPFMRVRPGQLPSQRYLQATIRRVQSRYRSALNLPRLRVSEIAALIHNNGYDAATHKIFGWGCGFDTAIFERILQHSDDVVVTKCDHHPQVDFARVVKLVADLSSRQLSFAHGSLIPDQVREFHSADGDVLAMLDIIKLFVKSYRSAG